jgi:hypothetical protein
MNVVKIEFLDENEREVTMLTSISYSKEQAILLIQHEEKHGVMMGIMTFEDGTRMMFDNDVGKEYYVE